MAVPLLQADAVASVVAANRPQLWVLHMSVVHSQSEGASQIDRVLPVSAECSHDDPCASVQGWDLVVPKLRGSLKDDQH